MSFDFGENPIQGGSFENPKIGSWPAVLESVIHIGIIRDTYQGKAKDPAPFLAVKLVVMDEDNLKSDGSYHEVWKTFPMFNTDKAFMMKFGKAFDPAFPNGTTKSFDEFIGRVCNVELKPSGAVGEDGKPKFVNVGSISGLSGTLGKVISTAYDETGRKPLGYFKHDEITPAVLEDMSAMVAQQFVTADNLEPGCPAHDALIKIRETDEDFGKRKKKEGGEQQASQGSQGSAPKPQEQDPNLDGDQEF